MTRRAEGQILPPVLVARISVVWLTVVIFLAREGCKEQPMLFLSPSSALVCTIGNMYPVSPTSDSLFYQIMLL